MDLPFDDKVIREIATECALTAEKAELVRTKLNRAAPKGGFPLKVPKLHRENRDALRRVASQLNTAALGLESLDFEVFDLVEHVTTRSDPYLGLRCSNYAEANLEAIQYNFFHENEDGIPEGQCIEVRALSTALLELSSNLEFAASVKSRSITHSGRLSSWMHCLHSIWEGDLGRVFSRSFYRSEPANPASYFVVFATRIVDVSVSSAEIEEAMKRQIRFVREWRRKNS